MVREVIKAPLIMLVLNVCVYIFLTMVLMLFMERVYMGIVIILVKLFWKKPEQHDKYGSLQDKELKNSNLLIVLVKIPMFNENEVYKVSIGASCNLSWLANRLVIQVLDDSIDPIMEQMVHKMPLWCLLLAMQHGQSFGALPIGSFWSLSFIIGPSSVETFTL
ncbi:Glucomannan 4-beta-mannosyltransferase 2, partial [Mucuna pruriens]